MLQFAAKILSIIVLGLLTSSVWGEEKPSHARTPDDPVYTKGYTIPQVDISQDASRQSVVDKEKGQYLGHPTTALLADGKTILAVYPKGHGKGAIVYKKSTDGGKTWSDRLPTPKSWETSMMAPIICRLATPEGKDRLILFSGTHDITPFTPVRTSVSEDNGETWSELAPIGRWGGVMAMTDIFPVDGKPGHYMATFHDYGAFVEGEEGLKERQEQVKKDHPKPLGWGELFCCRLYKTFTEDGGLTWSEPELIVETDDYLPIELGFIRSPDGKQIAGLIRDMSYRYNSQIIFSDDEGKTWTEPRPLPASLCGDRHVIRRTKDGRLFISFRNHTPNAMPKTPTEGDWVAWVGTYDDLVQGKEGEYRIRLMDNKNGGDCGYAGVVVLPDDTIVTTTYGHWDKDEQPYIMTVRLKLDETDRLLKDQK